VVGKFVLAPTRDDNFAMLVHSDGTNEFSSSEFDISDIMDGDRNEIFREKSGEYIKDG
jgi:hypothetical protein